MAIASANLGFPRIGSQRELKIALESHWQGKSGTAALLQTGAQLRARHWQLQKEVGLEHIPSNDFSFYDHVLDLSCMLGCVPRRYGWQGGPVDFPTYFAMARGDGELAAMEMSKWFDTNYHYIVPEFAADQTFSLSGSKVVDEYVEARALGVETRPVLIGPMTYVLMGKQCAEANYSRSTLIPKLVPVYIQMLRRLRGLGARWIQFDEPALALDVSQPYRDACLTAYRQFAAEAPGLNILVATYFDSLRDNTELAFSLPVAGIHIDLCRGRGQANTAANDADRLLDDALAKAGDKQLSLGIVDGRNIWKNDLSASLARVERAAQELGEDKVVIAPSCSLLHVPVDLSSETALAPALRNKLAFATEKLQEVKLLALGASSGRGSKSIAAAVEISDAVQRGWQRSAHLHDAKVQQRLQAITPDMYTRRSPFAQRCAIQRAAFGLPLFPTTTLGSFPQTEKIRRVRAAFRKGELDASDYREAMLSEIRVAVDFQHRLGLDVLVHGEPERNDMVEYFGEQLAGFAFTHNGWTQSYGSRCVKPPIIFGDVSRPHPMTVDWSAYAQGLTDRPMKGMLTGPTTILQWSFVRDDQPRCVTSRQIALAIRDEVADLERAGIRIIQIDEPALREGLPLRRADWHTYLEEAVHDFRIASCTVADGTQIHTHMCYSQFNDIIHSVVAMDADVISIETSRSHMELLNAFVAFRYPNEIGPGVYDVHSPRIPTQAEIATLLEKAAQVIDPRQLWVNPDCGLKTRAWPELEKALVNMVAAAHAQREKHRAQSA